MKHFSRLSISCLLVVWIAACDTADRPDPFDEAYSVDVGPAPAALMRELGKDFETVETLLTDEEVFTDEELATVTRLRLDPWDSFVFLDDSDIALLARCINLKELYLDGMAPQDGHLRGLAGLTALESLGLSKNVISDLTPLADFVNLRQLYLRFNTIRDIRPLAGLTNLQVLDLGYNEIGDITPLKGLIHLQELNLSHNQIVDLKPLVDNPGLVNDDFVYAGRDPREAVVRVWDNPLSEVSRTEHIPALQARGVIVCQ